MPRKKQFQGHSLPLYEVRLCWPEAMGYADPSQLLMQLHDNGALQTVNLSFWALLDSDLEMTDPEAREGQRLRDGLASLLLAETFRVTAEFSIRRGSDVLGQYTV